MPREALRTHYTYEDHAEFPDDGKRYEIVAGELIVNPAPFVEHQKLVARLFRLLDSWVQAGAGGELLTSPIDVHLAPDTIVQPDLIWITPARVPSIVDQVIRGAPDLVIEVISPRTARMDRTVKRDAYALHGVREYWLVDGKDRSVTILTSVGTAFGEHLAGTGDRALTSSIDLSLKIVPCELFQGLG